MWLTNEEQRLLCEALLDAFRRMQELRDMVLYRCNQRLEEFTDGPLGDRVSQLVQRADAYNWLPLLIDGAHLANRDNVLLSAFHHRFIAGRAHAGALERIVKQSRAMHDISTLREAIERVEHQVCRVVATGSGLGTGFLVARDVVLTCQHVVDGATPAQLTLEFDFKVRVPGKPPSPGRTYRVKSVLESSPPSPADGEPPPKPAEAGRHELDYALLQVDGAPGDEVVDGKPRGWGSIADPGHVIVPGTDLIIVQHPDGGPMKIAFDEVLAVNGGATRVTYTTNTRGGSSGSPCFNADWQIVALHHSGDPRLHTPAQYNEGIPTTTIHAQLENATRKLLGWP